MVSSVIKSKGIRLDFTMRTNPLKPTKPLVQRLKRRGIFYKLGFAFLLILTSCLVCVMIVKTNNTTIINHPLTLTNNSEVNNHTTNDSVVSVFTERIQTMAGNVRIPPNAESKLLYNTVRVLCWVLTMPANHVARARHVKVTWGRRCNKLIFMSSTTDPALGNNNVVNLNISEGRQHLWEKTWNALEYLYEHNLDDADWFLKADDDAYVIVENLRHFLRNRPSEDPVYFGYQFDSDGGAGYALSRRSLQLLVERGRLNSGACPNVSEAGDAQIDACLKGVGFALGDSRDPQGRDRFFRFVTVNGLPDKEYYEDEVLPVDNATPLRASDTAIFFHSVRPAEIYTLEYLVYHFKLKGGAFPNFEQIT